MLNENASAAKQIPDEREARRATILCALKADAETILARMADRLTDLPDDEAFGQIEYDLRDLAHDLAASAHQTGLNAGKKRATRVRALSAPLASTTPASSKTGPSPG